MTKRFGLTFILGTALLLIGGLFHAHGKDAYKVTTIYAYCHTPKVFTDTIEMSKTDGHPAAIAFLDSKLKSGECVHEPNYFLAGGVEHDIVDGAEGHEMILSGSLPNGKTVYVWINKPEYELFLEEGQST